MNLIIIETGRTKVLQAKLLSKTRTERICEVNAIVTSQRSAIAYTRESYMLNEAK